MKMIVLALAAVMGLTSAAQAKTTRSEVIYNIANNVIMATYVDFSRDAAALRDASQKLIAEPTQANLELAQAAWRKARHSYEVSEGFLFGPMDSLGIDPMIDTWPLALTDMKAVLKSNYTLDLEFIRTLPTEVLGFHAIEYILFGEGIVTNTRDVATITAREFQYLSGTTIILAEQTRLLMTSWMGYHDPEDTTSPGYLVVISNPGKDNKFYSSEEAVVLEFVNGIIGIINEASSAKLPDATGDSAEDANARLEESPFSWNSIADYTSNIDSIINVYVGRYANGEKGAGLIDLVANTNPALAKEIETEMYEARKLIIAIAGPNNISFGQAIKDPQGRARIFAAIRALQALQERLENEVVPLL